MISRDIYVDDCLSGEDTFEIAREVTDGLEIVLNPGGFRLNGITFSGFDPSKRLSNGDKSVNVADIWHPKSDRLSFNLSELNVSKNIGGKSRRI